MGSTDSTCCSTQPINRYSVADSTQKMKQNRKLQQIRTLRSPDFSPIPNNQIESVLQSYHESVQLKTELQKQYHFLTETDNVTDSNDSFKKVKYSKKNNNKRKYNHIDTQIDILISDGAQAQSLLLCFETKTIGIDVKKSTIKTFGFLPFVKTNLNDEAIKELFNKFPNNNLNISQFVSLLTIIVIAYKIKLHQLKNQKLELEIDAIKIQTSIEHLAMWCVRQYGNKQRSKKHVIVMDDVGNEIKGYYNLYKFNFTEKDCSCYLYEWIQQYVNADGKWC